MCERESERASVKPSCLKNVFIVSRDLFMYVVVSSVTFSLADHSFSFGCFVVISFFPLIDVCVSSRLTSQTLVNQLLIILAAPTEEAASCLTLMI